MRIVLDANVIVSGIITPRGSSGAILRAWQRGIYELCSSPEILAEVSRTLVETQLATRYELSPSDVRAAIEEIETFATMPTNPVEPIDVVRDPRDNHVLECAIGCQADLIVTNDDDLLALRSYEGFGIVSIRDFVRTLGLA